MTDMGDIFLCTFVIQDFYFPELNALEFIAHFQNSVLSKEEKIYKNLVSFFVSPELSSVRDYVITHSVRSM